MGQQLTAHAAYFEDQSLDPSSQTPATPAPRDLMLLVQLSSSHLYINTQAHKHIKNTNKSKRDWEIETNTAMLTRWLSRLKTTLMTRVWVLEPMVGDLTSEGNSLTSTCMDAFHRTHKGKFSTLKQNADLKEKSMFKVQQLVSLQLWHIYAHVLTHTCYPPEAPSLHLLLGVMLIGSLNEMAYTTCLAHMKFSASTSYYQSSLLSSKTQKTFTGRPRIP